LVKLMSAVPLETSLVLAPDLPIGITEMVVDFGLGWAPVQWRVSSVFTAFSYLPMRKYTQPSESTIDPSCGRRRDGLFNHLGGFVQVAALVGPAVAQIVEDIGLVGFVGEGGLANLFRPDPNFSGVH
jgi:hypothetical protein